jgi:hypothetical protein
MSQNSPFEKFDLKLLNLIQLQIKFFKRILFCECFFDYFFSKKSNARPAGARFLEK